MVFSVWVEQNRFPLALFFGWLIFSRTKEFVKHKKAFPRVGSKNTNLKSSLISLQKGNVNIADMFTEI
jgi:hypothetical protein